MTETLHRSGEADESGAMSRRSWLKRLSRVGGATTALATLSTARAAQDWRQSIPDDVYLVYDRDALQAVEPYLVTSSLDHIPYELYGLIATSGTENLSTTGNWDTNVAMFWATYYVQTGLTPWDSHLGDHEPMYVEYKPTPDGPELVRIEIDGYHWVKFKTDTFPTVEDNYGDKHPLLHIQNPYHFYYLTNEVGEPLSTVESVGLSDFRPEIQPLLDNGWPVYLPSITKPWVMRDRQSWWEEQTGGIRAAETVYEAALYTGVWGAEESEL